MNHGTEARNATILQLVTQLEPAGAQSMAAWLERVLQDVAPARTVFLYKKAPSDLFPEPNLVSQTRPRTLLQVMSFLSSLNALRRDKSTRVVLAHTHYAIILAALLWSFDRKVAVIAVHHWPEERYPTLCKVSLRATRLLGLLRHEVYVSQSITENEAAVIPNPVPAAGPYLESKRTADILVVARHAPEKSIETVIEAMAYLPRRSLLLVGGGPDTEKLRSLSEKLGVGDRVNFAGRLPNAEIRSLLQGARCFVLPSEWEAMPVALLEAVAERCPIAVSQIRAHDFLLSEGAAVGFAVKDALALADAIHAVDEPEIRRSLSSGMDRVSEQQSEKHVARAWQELLHLTVQVQDSHAPKK